MSTYSIGAMNQLGDALEKAGWLPEDVTKLKQFSNLQGLKDVLDNKAVISYPDHLIDCSAAPFIPPGWSIEEHQPGGLWKWDPAKISLYLSKKQRKGNISGHNLRRELLGKRVMNANVLDYLLAHPELIPEEWKGKYIFFWGTIYRRSDGCLFVRYLRWNGSEWYWSYYWLANDFYSGHPAALASELGA